MDIGTLTAAIARIQAEVDSMGVEFSMWECMDDAHEDGVRDGLVMARTFLQDMLNLELDSRDEYAERVANERYGEVQ